MNKIIIALIFMLNLLFSQMAFATDSTAFQAQIDENGKITVAAQFTPNIDVTILVVKATEANKDTNLLSTINEGNIKDNVVGSARVRTDKTGSFSKDILLYKNLPSGWYKVYVSTNSLSSPEGICVFYIGSVNVDAVSREFKAATEGTIEALITRYATGANHILEVDIAGEYADNNIKLYTNKLLVGEIAKVETFSSISTIEGLFNKCLAIASVAMAVDTGKLVEYIGKYKSTLEFTETADYLSATAAINNRFIAIRNARSENIKTTKDFNTLMEEATAIELINKNESRDELTKTGGIFERYQSVLGINLNGDYLKVNKIELAKKIIPNDYTTKEMFREAFDKAVAEVLADSNKDTPPSGGGGGGGGSSSGGSGSSGSGGITAKYEPQPEEDTKLPEPPADATVATFDDIPKDRWSYNAIKYLRENNTISGDGENNFRPTDSVTRSEFVKMVIEGFKLTTLGLESRFSDVKEGEWYYDYVCTADFLNIANGINEKEFGTSMNITREDAVAILGRLILVENITIPNDVEAVFEDADTISDYAKPMVLKLAEGGVIKGSDNKFNPTDNLTREETAQILYNILTLK